MSLPNDKVKPDVRRKVALLDVKTALKDSRFRSRLPGAMGDAIAKFLANPSCTCNLPLYRKVIREHADLLREYFPDAEIADEKEEADRLAQNHWSVINCPAADLEGRLRGLPPGRKQVAVARFEDQVTVVINELDLAF